MESDIRKMEKLLIGITPEVLEPIFDIRENRAAISKQFVGIEDKIS
jgi:hypothetical protein